LAQVNVPAQFLEELVFAAFHATAVGGGLVVVVLKMEHSVNEVPGEFEGPGHAKAAGLDLCLGGAEEDFTIEGEGGVRRAVIEGDDVGGTLLIQPAPIEGDHPGEREQVEAESVSVEAQLVFEEVTGGIEEGRGPDATSALAIADLDFVHGTVLPRCSS
jgi:hypothetical protein